MLKSRNKIVRYKKTASDGKILIIYLNLGCKIAIKCFCDKIYVIRRNIALILSTQ